MTPTQFRSATQDDYEVHKRMKDAYTDEELANRCGIALGSTYMVGGYVVSIDGIDVTGATRDANDKWRCRTETAWPLMKRTVGKLTFYDAQPVGGGVVHIDLDDGDEREFDINEWVEFKNENNLYKLNERREDVYEMHGQ